MKPPFIKIGDVGLFVDLGDDWVLTAKEASRAEYVHCHLSREPCERCKHDP